MYNGSGYPAQPDITMLPPDDEDADRDAVYNGGLAAQDVNAQHYQVNIPDDDQLTYGEGRTFQHSVSFADYPPHTLVFTSLALPAVAIKMCRLLSRTLLMLECYYVWRTTCSYLTSAFQQHPSISSTMTPRIKHSFSVPCPLPPSLCR